MRARLESGSRGSRAEEGVDCLKAADQSPCEAKKACLRRELRLRCEETWLAPERTAILYQSMREHASVA